MVKSIKGTEENIVMNYKVILAEALKAPVFSDEHVIGYNFNGDIISLTRKIPKKKGSPKSLFVFQKNF